MHEHGTWHMPDWWCRNERPANDSVYLRTCVELFSNRLKLANQRQMGNNQESFDKFRYQRSCFFYRRICSAVLKDPGIVRNKGKIKAILENAQNFIAIEKRYSSFQKYLDGLNKSDNYANATKDLINKFKWMGAPSESLFLYTVGEK